ncbi:MAG: membrane lipoprotein lipid attachment site-containing protein [Bacteroidetes bacterium]|nr:membrane lipoprotein lipid attachment site-containing protein [Bacteroidota bacterium]
MKKVLVFISALIVLAGCSSDPKNVQEFQDLVQKLDAKNQDIQSINKEIRDMVKEYNTTVGAGQQINFTGVDSLGFDENQQKVLKEMLDKEENVSYRGMIQKIVDKNAEIQSLNDQLAELKAKLPAPRRVKLNQTHLQLSLDYLTQEKGLDKKTAKEIVEKTMLIDELVPGFDVWMYFNEGTFGTFVTQGSAPVSPNKYKYSIRKEQIERAAQKGIQAYKDSLAAAGLDTTKVQLPEEMQ